MKKTVIIAAAGVGSRLGKNTPKCLTMVAGHYLFEYQIERLSWADEIRMVIGYQAARVIDVVRQKYPDIVFVENRDYAKTTTLQSNILGSIGLDGKSLFIDGDMIISRETAEKLRIGLEQNVSFVGVAEELSDTPVYACVTDDRVTDFGFDIQGAYEWANIAFVDLRGIPSQEKYFFEGLLPRLPLKALIVDRLEIDTPKELLMAEKMVQTHWAMYGLENG